MEEGGSALKILIGKPIGRKPAGRSGVDVKIILEWTLKKYISCEELG